MAKNLLKETLQKEGITQAELARESNVSQATINRLVNDKRGVSPTTQNRIVIGINKLSRTGRQYSVKEIFSYTTIQ